MTSVNGNSTKREFPYVRLEDKKSQTYAVPAQAPIVIQSPRTSSNGITPVYNVQMAAVPTPPQVPYMGASAIQAPLIGVRPISFQDQMVNPSKVMLVPGQVHTSSASGSLRNQVKVNDTRKKVILAAFVFLVGLMLIAGAGFLALQLRKRKSTVRLSGPLPVPVKSGRKVSPLARIKQGAKGKIVKAKETIKRSKKQKDAGRSNAVFVETRDDVLF